MRSRFLLFYTLLSFLLSCEPNDSGRSKLTLSFIPTEEASKIITRLDPIIDFVSESIGREIILYKASDYTAVIEGMKAQKVDIAFLGPYSYVLAAQKAGAKPLVMAGYEEGRPKSYHSVIIVKPESGIHTLQDLKSKASAMTFSFTDPASTSGHLFPRGILSENGMIPEETFSRVVFSGNHPAAILAVTSGRIDAAGCSFNNLHKMLEQGLIDADDFRVIWKSGPITVDLITVSNELDSSIIAALKKAFLEVSEEVTSSSQYFYQEWNDSTLTFIEAKDSFYQDIRTYSKWVRNSRE